MLPIHPYCYFHCLLSFSCCFYIHSSVTSVIYSFRYFVYLLTSFCCLGCLRHPFISSVFFTLLVFVIRSFPGRSCFTSSWCRSLPVLFIHSYCLFFILCVFSSFISYHLTAVRVSVSILSLIHFICRRPCVRAVAVFLHPFHLAVVRVRVPVFCPPRRHSRRFANRIKAPSRPASIAWATAPHADSKTGRAHTRTNPHKHAHYITYAPSFIRRCINNFPDHWITPANSPPLFFFEGGGWGGTRVLRLQFSLFCVCVRVWLHCPFRKV